MFNSFNPLYKGFTSFSVDLLVEIMTHTDESII